MPLECIAVMVVDLIGNSFNPTFFGSAFRIRAEWSASEQVDRVSIQLFLEVPLESFFMCLSVF